MSRRRLQEGFLCGSGCSSGPVLSPMLFITMLEALPKEFRET